MHPPHRHLRVMPARSGTHPATARRAPRAFRALSLSCLLFLLAGCGMGLKQNGPGAQSSAPVQYMDAKGYQLIDVEETDRPSAYFELEGKPFCFSGTNNYYLIFKSKKMVDDVFRQMIALDLKVMRFWGYLDIGSLDGSVRHVDGDGHKENVYFQYWDKETGAPAYHEGPNGLERLDYVLHTARKHGVKVILVLTNNWKEFGGIDQYVVWYGLEHHHQFYTDERVKKAYKAWVSHLVNRVNSIDGTPYRDDPAIFAWELANEPRCKNFSEFDAVEGWDTSTITKWAGEMSSYVKSLAPNHMVAVGDEGFLDNRVRDHGFYRGEDGVDHEALTALEHVDLGTFHLYPDNWGTGLRFSTNWIKDHIDVAQKLGKPTVLEEYGVRVKRNADFEITWGWDRRETAYRNWNNLMLKGGGNASMFWILVGVQDDDTFYPDYDAYSVYDSGKTAKLLHGFAKAFQTNARACELAAGAPSGEPSPFVRARPPPGAPSARLELSGAGRLAFRE